MTEINFYIRIINGVKMMNFNPIVCVILYLTIISKPIKESITGYLLLRLKLAQMRHFAATL